MKEFIAANNQIFECENIKTGIDRITFTMEDQTISDIELFFRNATQLTVSQNEGESDVTVQEQPYGIYEYLEFDSATVYRNGSVSVTMEIKKGNFV